MVSVDLDVDKTLKYHLATKEIVEKVNCRNLRSNLSQRVVYSSSQPCIKAPCVSKLLDSHLPRCDDYCLLVARRQS